MATLHRRIRNSLSKLDAFPKTEATYQTRTSSGGLLTIVLSGFLLVLAMSEFADYRRLEQKYEFLVDQSAGSSSTASKLQVNVDLTIAMKCECASLSPRSNSGSFTGSPCVPPHRKRFLGRGWLGKGGGFPSPTDDFTHGMLPVRLVDMTVDVTDVGGSSLHVKEALRMVPADFTKGRAHQLGQESQDALNVRRLIKDAQRPSPREGGCECSRFAVLLRTHVEKLTFGKRPPVFKDDSYSDAAAKSGCRVYGSFDVNKVMGNLHITALGHGYGGQHVPHEAINFTH
ncbi:MAG: endoplasmic reticulum-golgi intermediate compartment-domain-containing protein, partial [Olpidium bornovanus]